MKDRCLDALLTQVLDLDPRPEVAEVDGDGRGKDGVWVRALILNCATSGRVETEPVVIGGGWTCRSVFRPLRSPVGFFPVC